MAFERCQLLTDTLHVGVAAEYLTVLPCGLRMVAMRRIEAGQFYAWLGILPIL